MLVGLLALFGLSPAFAQEGHTTASVPGAAGEMSMDEFDAIVQERIIGGKNAAINDWPSVVALVRAPDGGGSLFDRQFCGGTVVSSRLILTAAHCVVSETGQPVPVDMIRIVGGTTSLEENPSTEERVVTNIYPHPDYQSNDRGVYGDIALLELAHDIGLPPAPLFTGNPEDYAGKMTSIVGWGAVEARDDNLLFTYELQEADVPIVARSICNQARSYDGAITDMQLCAGYQEGGVDTCSGDSGGPLFLEVDGQPVLTGITSYGNGCAWANYYGVYTSVASYVPWIRNYSADASDADGAEYILLANNALFNGASAEGSNVNVATTDDSRESTIADRTVNEASGGAAGGVLALCGLVLGERRRRSVGADVGKPAVQQV